MLLEIWGATRIAITIKNNNKISPEISNVEDNSQHMLVKLFKCHSFGSNKEDCSFHTSTSSMDDELLYRYVKK